MSTESSAELIAFRHDLLTAYAPLDVFGKSIDSLGTDMFRHYARNEVDKTMALSYFIKFAYDEWEKHWNAYCAFLENNESRIQSLGDGNVPWYDKKERSDKQQTMHKMRTHVNEIYKSLSPE